MKFRMLVLELALITTTGKVLTWDTKRMRRLGPIPGEDLATEPRGSRRSRLVTKHQFLNQLQAGLDGHSTLTFK